MFTHLFWRSDTGASFTRFLRCLTIQLPDIRFTWHLRTVVIVVRESKSEKTQSI